MEYRLYRHLSLGRSFVTPLMCGGRYHAVWKEYVVDSHHASLPACIYRRSGLCLVLFIPSSTPFARPLRSCLSSPACIFRRPGLCLVPFPPHLHSFYTPVLSLFPLPACIFHRWTSALSFFLSNSTPFARLLRSCLSSPACIFRRPGLCLVPFPSQLHSFYTPGSLFIPFTDVHFS